VRLARFEHDGTTRLGVVVDGGVVDLSVAAPDLPTDPLAFLDEWAAASARAADAAAGGEPIPLDTVRLRTPIPRPGKFLAIGLNYQDHLDETGRERPEFPVFFTKQPTCVIGPGDAIEVPRASTMVDYEGELGVVIGRRCRHLTPDDALSAVAGYVVVDDVSVRDWQMKSPTMMIGKSFDTHGPIGPWIVSADDVADPHDLRLRTWVNDQLLQDASTSGMLFSIVDQLVTLSTAMTLEPGDVVATGTPAGVGIARRPPVLLTPGDTVRIEIESVGVLENPVVAEPEG
jgi:2-keto-4-pentenoate hydratase/2-oxohepta-3-ene-1,7-dioic acid hydratase in catechol pathway